MKSVLKGISTIIFDLGGVILNIDPDRTANEFSKLSDKAIEEVYDIFLNNRWAEEFERGKISPQDFRHHVNKALHTRLRDAEIDKAWNAMLLDIPKERIGLINDLKPNYRTFVLSNTNEIHIDVFNQTFADVAEGNNIHDYFDKVYFSNEIGMRKPDHEIYTFVLESNNLDPRSTLFIDDMLPNIESAMQCGIKTFHLTDQRDLFKIFN